MAVIIGGKGRKRPIKELEGKVEGEHDNETRRGGEQLYLLQRYIKG